MDDLLIGFKKEEEIKKEKEKGIYNNLEIEKLINKKFNEVKNILIELGFILNSKTDKIVSNNNIDFIGFNFKFF